VNERRFRFAMRTPYGFPGVSLKPGQFQPFLVYIGIDGVHIGVPTTLYVWGR
jgi:hypothetical protein